MWRTFGKGPERPELGRNTRHLQQCGSLVQTEDLAGGFPRHHSTNRHTACRHSYVDAACRHIHGCTHVACRDPTAKMQIGHPQRVGWALCMWPPAPARGTPARPHLPLQSASWGGRFMARLTVLLQRAHCHQWVR